MNCYYVSLFQVFKVQDSLAAPQPGQIVAEGILRFFSGFEAFTLPPPTLNLEILRSINDNKLEINPLFFGGLEGFRNLLRTRLVPKNSFKDGELVTGEGKKNSEWFELCTTAIPAITEDIMILGIKNDLRTLKDAVKLHNCWFLLNRPFKRKFPAPRRINFPNTLASVSGIQ